MKYLKRAVYVLVVMIEVPFRILAVPHYILEQLDNWLEDNGWW